MYALAETIETAIDESIAKTSITWIDEAPWYDVDICDALALECEGESITGEGIHEFWGETCDGEKWRIHVRTQWNDENIAQG